MIEENKIAEKFKNQIVFLKDFDGWGLTEQYFREISITNVGHT